MKKLNKVKFIAMLLVVATKIVEAIGNVVSFSAFKATRSDVKKYYKLARGYGKKI